MTSFSSDRVDTSRGGLIHRHRLVALAGACAVMAAAASGWYVWRTASVSEPPEVQLFTSDADLITAVGNARTAVRAAPRSANAWGHLGMLLLAHAFLPEA